MSWETPHPRGELPRYYLRTLDPFVALGAAAVVTDRRLLGTGVCLIPEHHPIRLAKATVTADHLAGGRFLFGIGAGWNQEGCATTGSTQLVAGASPRERVLA